MVAPGRMVHHGGDLERASQRFGVSELDWIDLSTGISPWSWPVPAMPASVYQRLPPSNKALERAARMYYGQGPSPWLAVPGSQWAIAQLPRVLAASSRLLAGDRVAVPQWGYQEHAAAWARHGATCVRYRDVQELTGLVSTKQVRHAVIISPNNPTTERVDDEALGQIAAKLGRQEGWLVLDQAFADCQLQPCQRLAFPRVVYLRSLGKFFGLAGLRLGFVSCDLWLRRALARELGPWGVSHPAQWIGARALVDHGWHATQRKRIDRVSQAWLTWLGHKLAGLNWQSAGLFVTGQGSALDCQKIHEHLGHRGVLCRIFRPHQGHNLLRFGLPPSQAIEDWERWFGVIKLA